jgi:purine-binding chemotaxis protein CheW
MQEENMEEYLKENPEDTQHGRYLTFSLGNEGYGLEIKYVTEIIGLQVINQIPEMPSYIKGIINLRGKIIPAIDVRIKFKKEPIDYTDRTCIIVIDTGDFSVGLIVDKVAEVIDIRDDKIVPPLDTRTGVQNRYLKGICNADEHVKLLLDCRRLFMDDKVLLVEEL